MSITLLVGCSEDVAEVAAKAVQTDSPVLALTPAEYNNTVRELLGLQVDASKWPTLPADVQKLVPRRSDTEGTFGSKAPEVAPWPWPLSGEAGINGFEGMAKGQASSAYQVEQLQKAALTYGAYALVSPIFFVCDAAAWSELAKDGQHDCAAKSLRRFAQRAFRRPMTAAESTRLDAFFEKNWADGTAHEALVLTVAGVLQTPAFLYRNEAGIAALQTENVRPLTGWEMASRLSFFLWDSMPDATLFAAASKDQLRTKAQVKAQAERMLKDDRARGNVVRFHHQWLGTEAVLGMSPARRQYGAMFGVSPTPPLDTTGDETWPNILNPVRHALKSEADLFFAHVVFDGSGTLKAMLTDTTGFVSAETAAIYGLGTCSGAGGKGGSVCSIDTDKVDTSAANAHKVDFGGVAAVYKTLTLKLYKTQLPAKERGGVLTLGAWLAVGAHPVHPSPILRGVNVLERLLCRHLGSPPPTAEAGAPPDSTTAPKTNRERTETSTGPDACKGCHQQINPPGFAFEHYDSFGAFRALDNSQPVNAKATMVIPDEGDVSFENAVELGQKLAASPAVHRCYAQHWVNYATGVEVAADHPELKRLQSEFAKDSDIQQLLVRIVGSDLFRYRRAGGK